MVVQKWYTHFWIRNGRIMVHGSNNIATRVDIYEDISEKPIFGLSREVPIFGGPGGKVNLHGIQRYFTWLTYGPIPNTKRNKQLDQRKLKKNETG